MVGSMIVTGV